MKIFPVALQCVLLMITIRNYKSSGFDVSFCCFFWPVRGRFSGDLQRRCPASKAVPGSGLNRLPG
ncbi:hypothetical protein [Acidovorax radicis]|uniref:hypothetical protein n=1 Tax=Acidovorax radicis TaxID=758826 RepID=UPI00131F2717|nr:hypothetical protein [Acidovorax radicis]